MSFMMLLQRRPSIANATIGELSIEGKHECYTLEDTVRERKIYGQTAIPRGLYKVIITPSVRFKRDMPLLQNVPGYDGVRIHAGNTAADTEGCILLGDKAGVDVIYQSRVAFDRFYTKLQAALIAGDVAWIDIRNP